MPKTNHIIIVLLSVICGILGYTAAQIKDNSQKQQQTVEAVQSMLARVQQATPSAPLQLISESGDKNQITDGGYITKAAPPYPETALNLGQEGIVKIEVIIEPDGQISSARINQSSGVASLDHAAMSAAKSSRFKPKDIGGKPVRTRFIAAYYFKID